MKALGLGFSVLATVLAASLWHAPAASAAYNPPNLISDAVFQDAGSMSQPDIQSFLTAQRSGLAGFTDTENCGSPSGAHYSYYATYYSCGQNVLASKIIYDASRAYQISPRVLLATMQKEQSLVTDPSPDASQIQCAMGYQSCAPAYLGFFNQVDNGTWQFRAYIETMSNVSWWGLNGNANYACSDSHAGIPPYTPGSNSNVDRAGYTPRYYYPGLYPNNNVTFYDYQGYAYANFTIANAATAGMYCYTPHVYPGSPNNYFSGSYNFITWFEKWFGSTQNIVPRYNWTLVQQSAYTDSGRTKPFTGDSITLTPPAQSDANHPSTAYLTIVARNNTNQTWTQGSLRLGTSNPQDRTSVFKDSSWASNTRIDMQETSVLPGDTATFKFSVTAPATVGAYKEYFNLLIEGTSWLNDIGLYYAIDVVSPVTQPSCGTASLTAGQSIVPGQFLLSPDGQTTLNLQGDGNLVDYSNFRAVWANGANSNKVTQLILQPDGNLVEYGKDSNGNTVAFWNSNTANKPTAGSASANRLVLQCDGNIVLYNGNTPLWWTNTVSVPDHLSRVSKQLYPTNNLFVGQSLDTADRKYHLRLQSDGNLVLYSPTGAIWQSGTVGKAAAFLAMQGDGNLVLYDATGKALWTSGTSGRGTSSLVIQQDGNLVLYNSNGGPTWSTNTPGAQ